MATIRASEPVALEPGEAVRLWIDLRRWPAFVEGFGHVIEVGGGWPAEGGELVWQSTPGGRGRVSERVTAHGPPAAREPGAGPPETAVTRLESRVSEEALTGTQALTVAPDPGGAGARIELSLDYELVRGGPLRRLADVFFIRRALSDALERTLRRFAAEAEEEASR